MRCYNTEDVIDSMFDTHHNHYGMDGINFNSSKVFKVFLKTHTEKNQIEVPIFIDQLVPNVTTADNNNTYVYPISGEENRIERVGGVSTALKHLVNSWGRVLWAVNLKGNVYFGGAGIILDANYNPLLLTSTVYKKTNELIVRKRRVYLNPEIFTDSSKEVNRTISKKFLPYYLLNQKPEIIIGLPSHLMHYAVSPKKENRKKEHVVEVSTLKDNRDEIIKSIRNDYVFRAR